MESQIDKTKAQKMEAVLLKPGPSSEKECSGETGTNKTKKRKRGKKNIKKWTLEENLARYSNTELIEELMCSQNVPKSNSSDIKEKQSLDP